MADLPVPIDANKDRVLDAKELAAALQADHANNLNDNGFAHMMLLRFMKTNERLELLTTKDDARKKQILEGAVSTSLAKIKEGLPQMEELQKAGRITQANLDALKKIANSFDKVDFDVKDLDGVLSHAQIAGVIIPPPAKEKPKGQEL